MAPAGAGRDLAAGLTTAVANIPDAMASALMVGVSPVHGLYALMVGTPVGALATGSVLMNVSVTSAMALATADALGAREGEQRVAALVVLTLLIGLLQLVAGLLRLGGLVRFVSNAVMTGFLTGIGVLIVLSQLGDLTGYRSPFGNKVVQALDLLTHPGGIDPATLLVGPATVGLVLLLRRTPLAPVSMLVALLAVAVLVPLLGLASVQLVGESVSIPRGLPSLARPDLALVPALVLPAAAVAIIGLVQGAGVSQGYPNPDGRYPDASRDFRGQGLANLAAGAVRGLPVGGSLSSTALVVGAGARSRLANVATGLFVAGGVLLFAGAIERLPFSALAGLLVLAGIETLNPARIATVWRTNAAARAVMAITFLATLALPVPAAVFLGVAASFVLSIAARADRVRLVELVPLGDGRFEECDAPESLPGGRVTALLPYGSLFFAAVAGAWLDEAARSASAPSPAP